MSRLLSGAVRRLIAGTPLVDLLLRGSRNKLRILMYHGVAPGSLTPQAFSAQLEFLKHRFESYWVSEIPELLDSPARRGKPPIVLTFDDGLKNNLTYAAPLLSRHGIKATFYLVGDLLDGNRMLWNHEMRCRLMLAADSDLPSGIGPFSAEPERRWIEIRSFVETVKAMDDPRRLALLDAVRSALPEPSYQPWMLEQFEIMTAREASGLPPEIEVGSHTLSHPILVRLAAHEARREIQDSRRAIESATGREVTSFCYPDGQKSPRDVELAREVYCAAVSVDEGLVRRGDDLFTLKRIPAADNLHDFKMRLIRPTT